MKTVVLTCGVIFALLAITCAIFMAASYHPRSPANGGPQPWWSDRAAGLTGAAACSVIGSLGCLIGVLTSMGKARALVIGLVQGLTVLGVICLIFGVVALFKEQPYAVYYPALLTGLILTLVMGLNTRTIEARYREIELQRMRLRDVQDEGAPNG